MLGSLLAMAGAIIVAFMYIRNQTKNEKRRRLNEQIQKTYIEQGILAMQTALSEYGVSAVLGIHDLSIWAMRAFKLMNDPKLLERKIEEIKQRPAILDLTQRKFSLAMPSFSYLYRFGISIYGSIISTLQYYSEIFSEVLIYEYVYASIKEIGIDEFGRSGEVFARILELTQLYLQTRLDNLKEYILQKDFEDYTDFLSILQEEKYKTFVSDFEQYKKLLSDLMDATKSEDPEVRKNTSLAFSKWLNENTSKNPLA